MSTLMLAGGATLATTVGTVASASVGHKTPLQQGMAFYKGKTIDIIEGGGAGGAGDLWVRTLAPYVATYLHATVIVTDVSASGGITGSDEAASAAPTGLTWGSVMTVDSMAQAITGDQLMNYNINRLAWLGGEAPTPTVVLANPSAHITMGSLRNSSGIKAIVANAGSTTGTTERAMFNALNAKMTYVSGYPTTTSLIQGFVRGDAPIFLSSAATGGPLVVGNQATPIAVTFKLPVGSNFRAAVNAAPSFAQVFQQYPPKGKTQIAAVNALLGFVKIPSQTLILQTAVKAAYVDAARAAVAWAFKQPGIKTSMLALALNPQYVDPITAKADFVTGTKAFTALACAFNGTC